MRDLNKTRIAVSVLFLLIGAVSVSAINNLLHPNDVPDVLGESVSLTNIPKEVLGEKDENPIFFTVNVPSRFKKDISAPNILYSVTGGEGIKVSEGQYPEISNTGVLSLQGLTGELLLTSGDGISINGLEVSNTLSFIGSGGTTVSRVGDAITVTSSTPDYTLSGWAKVGTSVGLTTATDSVTVDTIIFGNATITNGKSIRPDTDLGSDLGSAAFRFNNLYVGNINSNSSTSTAGQATFTYEALSTALTEASVLINPTAPVANGQLLGLSVAGYQRALIDEDGDLTLGYNDAISAPASDYPLSVYGHSGIQVSFIDTSGNAYFAGDVGIGAGDLSMANIGTTILTIDAGSHALLNLDKAALNKQTLLTFKTNSVADWSMGTAADVNFGDGSDFFIGTDYYTPGNVAFFIDRSSGNVGIGTTTPTTTLDVLGDATVASSDGLGTLYFGRNSYGYGGSWPQYIKGQLGHWFFTGLNGEEFHLDLNAGTASIMHFSHGDVWLNANATGAGLKLQTQGSTKLFIEDSGEVGIGTETPSYKLHVDGTIASYEGSSLRARLISVSSAGNLLLSNAAGSAVNIAIDSASDKLILSGASAGIQALGLADTTQFTVKGHSTQTANLQEWQDSGGTVLGGVDERGIVFSNGGTGASNFFGGETSGNTSTTGVNNVAIGDQALFLNTTGGSNNAFGYRALYVNQSGTYNNAMGRNALRTNNSGSGNNAFGISALSTNSSGNYNNAIGYLNLNYNTIGSNNNALGYLTLYDNTTGGENNAIGRLALRYSQTGSGNNVLGVQAGGAGTGTIFTGADFNTILGHQAGYNLNTDMDKNVYIGYQAGYDATGSDQLYIDNSSSATPLIWGDFANDVLAITGDVGIGTDNPQAALHVGGTTNQFRIDGPNSTYYSTIDDVGGWLNIKAIGSGSVIRFYANGQERLRIHHDGSIGIGTTDPLSKLDLSNDVSNSDSDAIITLGNRNYYPGADKSLGSLDWYNGDTSSPAGVSAQIKALTAGSSDGGGDLVFSTRTEGAAEVLTEYMRITHDGKMGIGTDTPSYPLEVNRQDLSGVQLAKFHDSQASFNIVSSGGSPYISIVRGAQTALYVSTGANCSTSYCGAVGTQSASDFYLFAGSVTTPRLSILNANGNVGIGTTAPTKALHVVSSATNTAGLMVTGGNSNDTNAASGQIFIGAAEGAMVYSSISMGRNTYDLLIDNTVNNDTSDIRFRTRTSGTPIDALTITGAGLIGINDTTPSYPLDVTGMMRATEGVVTYTKAGTISDTDFTETAIDGLMGVDSTNGRLYFRHGGAWHYVAQTAGFQIPKYETFTYDFNTSSFDTTSPLADGDFLIPFVEGRMSDGAIHGLYTSFNDVKDELFADELSRILSLEQRVTALEAGGGLTTNPLLSSSGSIGSIATWADNLWTFLGDTVFKGDTTFEGEVLVSSDTAGAITIPAGKVLGAKTFSVPYSQLPSVYLTPQANIEGNYFVQQVSANSFTIELSQAQLTDVTLNWFAIIGTN